MEKLELLDHHLLKILNHFTFWLQTPNSVVFEGLWAEGGGHRRNRWYVGLPRGGVSHVRTHNHTRSSEACWLKRRCDPMIRSIQLRIDLNIQNNSSKLTLVGLIEKWEWNNQESQSELGNSRFSPVVRNFWLIGLGDFSVSSHLWTHPNWHYNNASSQSGVITNYHYPPNILQILGGRPKCVSDLNLREKL